MTVVLFVGPTLRPEEILTGRDFVCLPPVAQGDVYRATERRPKAIGVIDGYFSGAPSVWHKEILWAMSQGVYVFGAASMGALRAAELHEFGMRGVGRIFEAFRDGTLEDDDEVAIVHGPAEIGYLSASEAMVNIRATLAAAAAVGVLSAAARQALEAFAKSLYFAERCWPALLDGAPKLAVAQSELASLRDWLPHGRVDQKRLDALAMIATIEETLAAGEPSRPHFQFERTYFWDEFVARAVKTATSSSASAQSILDELRLEGPDAYERVEERALLRMMAINGVGRLPTASQDALRRTLSETRAKLGLYARADLDRWILENDLDEAAVERLIKDETSVKALRGRAAGSIEPYLLDDLRLSGAYARLAQRAQRKAEVIAGLIDAGAPTPHRTAALRLWYFEQRLSRSLPVDIERFVLRFGFADERRFDQAVHGEWLFLNLPPRA